MEILVWVPMSQVLPAGCVLLHSLMLWDIDGKNLYICFPCEPIYGNLMEENHPCFLKVWITISWAVPMRWVCCLFQCYGLLMRKPLHFPCDEANHNIGIRWKRTTHIFGKVWVPISKVLPNVWICCIFL